MTALAPDPLLAVVLRRYEEGWNQGNLEVLDELLAADFRAHDPSAPGGVVDREDVRAMVTELRRAYPNIHREALDHVAHGDKIAVLWRITGTPCMGFATATPPGRILVVTGITLYLIHDDQIHEEWVAMDPAGLSRWVDGG